MSMVTYRQNKAILTLKTVFQTLSNVFEVLLDSFVGSLKFLSKGLQAPLAIGLPWEFNARQLRLDLDEEASVATCLKNKVYLPVNDIEETNGILANRTQNREQCEERATYPPMRFHSILLGSTL